MQSNITLKKVRTLSNRWLLTAMIILTGMGSLFAQTYVNGALSTGTVSSAGETAPTGYTWSEVQNGNTSAGVGANISAGYTVADDFTIPAGETWNITSFKFYAYSSGYAGTTSPFEDVRIQIYNTNPSVGTPAPIGGDLVTNRFASSTSASMYRLFWGQASSSGSLTTREIWEINANLNITLTPGTYWIEWQVGTVTGVTSNFSPTSTISGQVTQAGNNAVQKDHSTGVWTQLYGATGINPQDMPFSVSYSNACTGTPPTVSVSSTGACGAVTLTASGADTYTWSPSDGLSATTGATVNANPTVTTTYTVTGTAANGCSNIATIVVGVPPSAAVLSGAPPTSAQLEENFDAGIPATWTLINNSNPVGSVATWGQGTGTVFTAYNGADDAYAFANYNSVGAAGSIISNWLITPQITTINNGDKLVFYTRTTTASSFPDRLEVRLSTAGASTNVGATDISVGDFTTLLVSVNPDLDPTPAYPDVWTRFEVTISGLASTVTGRIGFRYFVEDAGPLGNNSDYIGLDAVSYFSPSSACGTGTDVHNLNVNITGGAAPYTVVYSDGTNNITVNGYNSGDNIPVTPTSTTDYTLVSVTDANGCTSTNNSGSYLATLAPVLVSGPTDTDICIGSSANISVVVSGANLTYQWQISTDGGATWTDVVNGGDYSGATTETLTISNGTAGMAGHQFRVIYGSAACGVQTSGAATLSLGASATITSNPSDVTICSGLTASFSVTISDPTASIIWEVSTDGGLTWNPIAGATTTTLDINNVDVSLNGNIYRAALSSCGTPVYSSGATLTVNESAVLTADPTSVSVCAGDNATFSATVTGPNVVYQWQVSTDGGTTWTDIAGANATSLDINNVDITLNGNVYRVLFSNPCTPEIQSDPATLTVTSATSIVTQPVDVTICSGTDANFLVDASGATGYQWQESTDGGTTWTDIAGATNVSYSINGATTAVSGNKYRVIVSGCPSAITSNEVTLTVNEGITITTQPASQNACSGSDVNFTIAANGTAVSYQWQESTDGGVTWTDIAGATTDTYTITAVTAASDGYQYRVVTSNICTASLTSDVATLSVGATASITTQPADVTVCEGVDATFTVVAASATSYQWQVSTDGGTTWTDVAGATADSYTVTAATSASNAYQYQVVIGSCPSPITSSAATLTVNPAVSITTQPANDAVCDGGDISFNIAAANVDSYQWQVSTDGGVTWTDIAGATNSTLDLTAVALSANNNQYRVVVGNTCGTVNSDAAVLTVNELPVVTANGPSTTCEGSTITLNGGGANAYTWDNGVTDNTPFVINSTTTYTVTGTDANGCVNDATITVNVTPNPVVTISATATEIPAGGSVTITATSTPAVGSYIWRKDNVEIAGETGSSIVVTEPGVYTAEATDGGCTGVSNAITITVLPSNFSFITPNPNDGNFEVRVRNTPNVSSTRQVMVFDRKGARVFAKTFISNGAGDVEVMSISLPNVANGAYFLTLYENGYIVKTALVYINR